ncbi:MAG: hypothetical protein ABI845_04895 [Polaromonas sp.]
MSKPHPVSPLSTPLRQALDQNEAVKDTVEQSAAELVVINAVLKQEVPPQVQTGEVAQALQKTDELEERIQASAEDLGKVNDALKQEIGERARLEQELAAARADLARAKAAKTGCAG